MTHRIFSRLKPLLIAMAFRKGSAPALRTADVMTPEPVRQPFKLPVCSDVDSFLFDATSQGGMAHRMDMLAGEMTRLSTSLSGLRSLLSDVATAQPMLAIDAAPETGSPLVSDDLLFDGEPMAANPNAIPAAGGADFLFADDATAEPAFEQLSLTRRAA